MQSRVSESSRMALLLGIMAILPICSDFIIYVFLRLDDDCPPRRKSRIVNIKVVGLEGEACEYR